jgi:hypothetical protein
MGDYRVSTSWRTHPKRLELERRLGKEAVLAVMDLWSFCAENPSHSSGDLTGMDDEDIALAADYKLHRAPFYSVTYANDWGSYVDYATAFVSCLLDLNILEGEHGHYRLVEIKEF